MDKQFQCEAWYFECRKINYLMELKRHGFPTESLCYNVHEDIKDVMEHVATAGETIWTYDSKGLTDDLSWVPLDIRTTYYGQPKEVLASLLEMKESQSALLWVYREKLDYAVHEGTLEPNTLHSLYVNKVKHNNENFQFHIHDLFPEYIGWVDAHKVRDSMEDMADENRYIQFLEYQKDKPLIFDRKHLWQAFLEDIRRSNNHTDAYERFWNNTIDWNELYGSFMKACDYHSDTWSFLAGSRYLIKRFLEWMGHGGKTLDYLENYVHKALLIRNVYLKAMMTGKEPNESAWRLMKEAAEADEQAFASLKESFAA